MCQDESRRDTEHMLTTAILHRAKGHPETRPHQQQPFWREQNSEWRNPRIGQIRCVPLLQTPRHVGTHRPRHCICAVFHGRGKNGKGLRNMTSDLLRSRLRGNSFIRTGRSKCRTWRMDSTRLIQDNNYGYAVKTREVSYGLTNCSATEKVSPSADHMVTYMRLTCRVKHDYRQLRESCYRRSW